MLMWHKSKVTYYLVVYILTYTTIQNIGLSQIIYPGGMVGSRAVVKSTFVESKTSPSPKRFESESSPRPKRFESESSPSPKRFESKSK